MAVLETGKKPSPPRRNLSLWAIEGATAGRQLAGLFLPGRTSVEHSAGRDRSARGEGGRASALSLSPRSRPLNGRLQRSCRPGAARAPPGNRRRARQGPLRSFGQSCRVGMDFTLRALAKLVQQNAAKQQTDGQSRRLSDGLSAVATEKSSD